MSVLKTLTINGTTYKVSSVVPTSSVTLLADKWVVDGSGYSQVVEIEGVTARSKVNLQPTKEQLDEFLEKILAFVAKNDEGVVTIYSVGDKPSGDHTVQITMREVEGTGPVWGNTVGTPTRAEVISISHEWNGTVLTVTSASGTSSADLKGEKGEQGIQGIPGEKGEKGDKGDKGDPGDSSSALPAVTADDNGKFLRVVDGVWAATKVDSAEEASF